VRNITAGLFCLLFLGTLVFSQGEQSGDNRESFVTTFSQTLLRVVEASGNGFSDIKGPPDPASNGEAWFSTLQLPTARQCTVWIYRDHSLGRRYSCDFGRTFRLDEAQNSYSQALQIVSQSLPGWSKSESARTSSKTPNKAEFTKDSSKASVTLRLTDHGAHGYLLYVDVNPRD
jgi:hypothetical protein